MLSLVANNGENGDFQYMNNAWDKMNDKNKTKKDTNGSNQDLLDNKVNEDLATRDENAKSDNHLNPSTNNAETISLNMPTETTQV